VKSIYYKKFQIDSFLVSHVGWSYLYASHRSVVLFTSCWDLIALGIAANFTISIFLQMMALIANATK